MFPHIPLRRETVIAEHACLKYSGRVGRSSAAKNLSENTIRLAVIAHIRHAETEYDELLAKGYDRLESRSKIEAKVGRILTEWEGKASPSDLQSEYKRWVTLYLLPSNYLMK